MWTIRAISASINQQYRPYRRNDIDKLSNFRSSAKQLSVSPGLGPNHWGFFPVETMGIQSYTALFRWIKGWGDDSRISMKYNQNPHPFLFRLVCHQCRMFSELATATDHPHWPTRNGMKKSSPKVAPMAGIGHLVKHIPWSSTPHVSNLGSLDLNRFTKLLALGNRPRTSMVKIMGKFPPILTIEKPWRNMGPSRKTNGNSCSMKGKTYGKSLELACKKK